MPAVVGLIQNSIVKLLLPNIYCAAYGTDISFVPANVPTYAVPVEPPTKPVLVVEVYTLPVAKTLSVNTLPPVMLPVAFINPPINTSLAIPTPPYTINDPVDVLVLF